MDRDGHAPAFAGVDYLSRTGTQVTFVVAMVRVGAEPAMDRYRTNSCLNRASAGSTQSLSRPVVGLKIRSRAAIHKYVDKVHVIGAASGTRFIFEATTDGTRTGHAT